MDGPLERRGETALNIAVIGAGVSGLSAAWLLSKRHRVTLYEQATRLGGHANTVNVRAHGVEQAVDTGFMVYNEPSYPNLTALFAHLGVETRGSDMSFAASLQGGAIEYAGNDLRSLFAQKRNLVRPRFWSMLRDVLRLYRIAPRAGEALVGLTLGAWLDARGFGRAVQDDHVLPMVAAIWSCPVATARDYPAEAFVAFCVNHGLFRLSGRPVWRTVVGGSRRYVAAIEADMHGTILRNCAVTAIDRAPGGVAIADATGRIGHYDHVVVATSAQTALALLPTARDDERALLGAFEVTRNLAVLHTDEALMPRRRSVWSSWNFMSGGAQAGDGAPEITYWLNRLQGHPGPTNLFLTLNPTRAPKPSTLIRAETYEHPVFTLQSLAAQRRLWSLQGRDRTWFAGAWFGSGFHEDGLQAGLAVAEELGGVSRPWHVADPSGRIHLPAAPAMASAAAARAELDAALAWSPA